MADESTKMLIHLLRHILIAAGLFCAVAAIAILLWYSTVVMEQWGVPKQIWLTCFYLSEVLFWTDVFCMVVYLASEVYKWLREILESLRT